MRARSGRPHPEVLIEHPYYAFEDDPRSITLDE